MAALLPLLCFIKVQTLTTLKPIIMKTINFLTLAIFATLFVSCSKKTDTVSPSVPSVAEQKSMVASTSWSVNYFVEGGVDKTAELGSYRFVFNANGSVMANGSSASFNGTWNLTQSDTKPDDSGNHSTPENKMNILITGNKNMDDISKNWKITRLTASEMWLADDNTTSMEEIHFTK
jgi:hypothetical protein